MIGIVESLYSYNGSPQLTTHAISQLTFMECLTKRKKAYLGLLNRFIIFLVSIQREYKDAKILPDKYQSGSSDNHMKSAFSNFKCKRLIIYICFNGTFYGKS